MGGIKLNQPRSSYKAFEVNNKFIIVHIIMDIIL